MKREFTERFQKYFFGIIIDPICFLISYLVVVAGKVSMFNELSPRSNALHFFIGVTLLYIARVVFSVYKQDWRKLPIYGIVRLAVSEGIACIIHYFAQGVVTPALMTFIHIFSISAVDLILSAGARVLFFGWYRKGMPQGAVLLSSPTMHDEEQLFIKQAFERNWVAPLGFNCDGFESEMVSYLAPSDKNLNALATVSGTSAIHLAVMLAGVKAGDTVFCSDFTFAATVNPLMYQGAVPVFVDSEPDTWNMSPEALERAFEKYPDTKTVVLAHLYGTPAKMDEIIAICEKHGATLVEDSAEALGSKYKGISCGTFGQYNALSFNGNKIITTSGGGMLIVHDPQKRKKALFWATQSREDAPWYQHNEVGYNYRMSNVVAGIGRGQLAHLEEHKALKTEIYNRYKKGLAGLPVSMNPYIECTSPNFWLSCMVIDKDSMCPVTRTDNKASWTHIPGKSCPDEIAYILKKEKIDTRPVWKPMHLQPIFEHCDFISTGVDEDIFNRGICLPSDIKMSHETQDNVIEIIRRCFDK